MIAEGNDVSYESLEGDPDWNFCWEQLLEVSRTFSRPIDLLPDTLRVATTCGYLLCRIADTVEDHGDLSTERRDHLYRAFLDVLEGDASPQVFTNRFADIPGEGPEFQLSENLDRVWNVFEQLPEPTVGICTRWVGEMTRGMQLYGHRPTDEEGLRVLHNPDDLERYCYYVAGTVGRLLTELFEHHVDDLDDERALAMQRHAEPFGLGLQMVNVLKDQTDDFERGWSFIPRSSMARHGLSPTELHRREHRETAHDVVRPLFERAADHLDDALEYTLAIPPEHRQIRLFCLLPLWMAVRTLVCAEGNDAMFESGEPVKISRDEVESLIADAVEHAGDDDVLRSRYDELWEGRRHALGTMPH
jgi:farnesyl-diphosphate farnesyltransferase